MNMVKSMMFSWVCMSVNSNWNLIFKYYKSWFWYVNVFGQIKWVLGSKQTCIGIKGHLYWYKSNSISNATITCTYIGTNW